MQIHPFSQSAELSQMPHLVKNRHQITVTSDDRCDDAPELDPNEAARKHSQVLELLEEIQDISCSMEELEARLLGESLFSHLMHVVQTFLEWLRESFQTRKCE